MKILMKIMKIMILILMKMILMCNIINNNEILI